jgi:hypothetical protein
MKAMMNRCAFASPAVLILAATGCTTVSQSFPGHSPQQVWQAMVTVAQQPRYDDWKVLENNTWADEAGQRIEIDRVLHREKYVAGGANGGMNPWYEKWEWKFSVKLLPTDPPSVDFTSRGWAVPMQARIEAERYLDDVKGLLSAPPL